MLKTAAVYLNEYTKPLFLL